MNRLVRRFAPARPGPEGLTLIALAVLTAAVVLANDWGVLTPDTKPETFLAPWRTAVDFARPWLDSPELGYANFNVGMAPVAALLAAADGLGLPAWLGQRAWRIGLLLIAGSGARALYRQLTRGTAADTAPGRVAAAVAYVANPYVIVGGGTTPTLLPYALLPLVVVALLRGIAGRGWGWSAAAALALAATSGINAGVVTLLQLVVVVPIVVHVAVCAPARLPRALIVLLQTGVLFVLLSLYWLVPALAALARGSAVVAVTERLDSVNVGSSLPEVLRGLGMWTLYGADGDGPFLPGQTAYLLAPVVVVLTLALPGLAALGARLSDSPARILATASLATGALVMAAPFPFADRSPWGDLVVAGLEGIPGAGAFRTLNKAGAVLVIGTSLLTALAVAVLAARWRTRVQRALALLVSAALAAAATAPAWTGGLFPVTLDLPGYWDEAGDRVNALGAEAPGRVLMTPGIKLAEYDWGYSGPDELGNSLFTAPTVFRSVTSTGAPEAAALLGEVDQRLYLGVLAPGTTSVLADLIGVGVIVGRYDLALEPGARDRTEAALGADPGLGEATVFGGTVDAPAVTVRAATGAAGPPTLIPAAGAAIVDGGPDALPDLVAAGILPGASTLLPAAPLTDEALAAAVADGGRIVLSDSNRRVPWSDNPARTGALSGATSDPATTRALYSARDQTLAHTEGNARVTTSGPGQIFGPFPTGDPLLAFDGDQTTSWEFGNFGTGVGNALTVHLDSPRALGQVTVRPARSDGPRVTALRVHARGPDGEVERDVQVGPWPAYPATIDLGPGRFSAVTVEVGATEGAGTGWVGIAEIDIPGIAVRKVARTPAALPERLAALGSRALAAAPIDVLLHRRSGAADGLSAEEPRLERDFSVPDTRSYELSGTVRLAPGAPDAVIEELLGNDGTVIVTGSSRAGGDPRVRAALAFDNWLGEPDLNTGWEPAAPVIGESLVVDFPRRRIAQFTIVQNDTGAVATRALVSVDDGEPMEVTLRPGTTRVHLPETVEAGRVRILLTEVFGQGRVRIRNVGLPRVAYAEPAPDACLEVASLDGAPLLVRPTGDAADLLAGPVPVTACESSAARVRAGVHRIRSVPGYAIDDLRLRSDPAAPPGAADGSPIGAGSDTPGGDGPPAGAGSDTPGVGSPAAGSDVPVPAFSVTQRGPTRVGIVLESDCAPCYFSAGQGMTDQWRATLGGADLGDPLVVDGYAAGWRIEGRAGDRIEARYGPAAVAGWAWGASLLAAVGALVLARRRGTLAPLASPRPGGGAGTGASGLDRSAANGGHEAAGGSAAGDGPGPGAALPAAGGPEAGTSPETASDSESGLDPVAGSGSTGGGRRLALAAGGMAGAALLILPPRLALAVALLTGATTAIAWVRRRERPLLLLDVACLAFALLPLAWYVGPQSGTLELARRVTGNWLAHGLAGYALILLAAGVVVDPRRRIRAGVLSSPAEVSVDPGGLPNPSGPGRALL